MCHCFKDSHCVKVKMHRHRYFLKNVLLLQRNLVSERYFISNFLGVRQRIKRNGTVTNIHDTDPRVICLPNFNSRQQIIAFWDSFTNPWRYFTGSVLLNHIAFDGETTVQIVHVSTPVVLTSTQSFNKFILINLENQKSQAYLYQI